MLIEHSASPVTHGQWKCKITKFFDLYRGKFKCPWDVDKKRIKGK
jgi:hypothetical protein